ncbi:hypothetical protein BDV35DRAFT_381266 [Aspergillus flavus]|uniref:Uncharacterized protein n=1 Tax=Aspergillus flavus TaxID=5059 RepID=A0A5N6GX98_ASPFL|nr:hypothetical protein BDV35DRAFT_381266 [Aspergillus flavus]
MANKTYEYGELVVTLTSSFNAIWNDVGSGTTRDGGFRPLGTSGALDWSKSTSSSNPPVKAPTSYTQLWADKGSGAKLNGSFWRPIAASGYIAMGDVVQSGYTTPSTSKVWCLRSDLVADGQYADERFRNTQPVPTFTASTIPSTGTTYTWVGQCEVTLPFTSFYDDADQRSLQLTRNSILSSQQIDYMVTTDVSSGESTELAHSTGVSISASTCVLVKLKINLN